MLGQIATFMESLHLTYDEVVNKIPYRTLLIMSKDKVRIAYGEVDREMTSAEEEEFITRKMAAQNNK